MKILIVSDTHGRFSRLQDLIEKVGKPDVFIHCGDIEGDEDYIRMIVGKCECHMVRGNCDGICPLPFEELFELCGHRIFLTHGHRYGVELSLDRIKAAAAEKGADIVLFGHTHIPTVDSTGDVIAANPGSLSRPRQEGCRPSYMLLDFDKRGTPFFSDAYL